MEEALLGIMEFVIELSVPTAFTTLIAAGVSVFALNGQLYKQKAWLFGLPVGLSIVAGAMMVPDHTKPLQWAYFVLPTMALSLTIVMIFFRRKRVTP